MTGAEQAARDEAERARDETERARDEHRAWLRGPESYLAAVARHELRVGETVHLHGHVIDALPDGFRVDGETLGPRTIDAGRYRLRLSHQNAPAVVVLDADAPKADLTPAWFPYDPAFRYVLALELDPLDLEIASTRAHDREATRAGWFRFGVRGVDCRLAALRLREPGASPDVLHLYFSDATSGHESYRMRYIDVQPEDDGRYVVDFNDAYNPACVFSPHYNCPIPPPQNRLVVAIPAGERLPVVQRQA